MDRPDPEGGRQERGNWRSGTLSRDSPDPEEREEEEED